MIRNILNFNNEVYMRKMATIRKIDNILPIPNADRIECAIIDGWSVVIGKDTFKIGETVIFCEIDSWIPTNLAPFLTKPDKFPKNYNGIDGERIRTVRLRGQLSQGLILPIQSLMDCGVSYCELGDDVAEKMGIQKWEAPVSANIAGNPRGSFPSDVPKTDEERIQNLTNDLKLWRDNNYHWEITEKLDGSSGTFYLDFEENFYVCSRNINLKDDDKNIFWRMAKKYNLEEEMKRQRLFGFALQGEIVGPGIQGNIYKLPENDFYLFRIYNVKAGEFLSPEDRKFVCRTLGLKHVPVISNNAIIDEDIDGLLECAEGPSQLNHSVEREGIVFKSNTKQASFKVISNKYLLGEK